MLFSDSFRRIAILEFGPKPTVLTLSRYFRSTPDDVKTHAAAATSRLREDLRKVRLNDWQKIGVILTLLWCLVGGLWINNLVMNDMKTAIVLEHRRCLAGRSSQPNASISSIDRSTCGEKFSANWNRNAQDRWKERAAFTLAYTLVPGVG